MIKSFYWYQLHPSMGPLAISVKKIMTDLGSFKERLYLGHLFHLLQQFSKTINFLKAFLSDDNACLLRLLLCLHNWNWLDNASKQKC